MMRIWLPIRITLAHGVQGGMERQADTLARGLARRGHQVTIVTTAHPDGVVEENDLDLQTLYIPHTTWRRYQPHWWRQSYQALRDRHALFPYDVILSQSAGGLGYLGQAQRHLGLPSVVILHGSSQGEVVTAWRGARNPRGIYRLLRLGWRLPPLLARWRRVAASVSHWIAVSPTVGVENQREIGFPTERLSVVLNGVDVDTLRPDPQAPRALRERLGLPPATLLLAITTRLEYEKGVQIALEALARLLPTYPNLYLLVAGAGVYDEALQRRALSLGVGDRARFLGFLQRPDLATVLAGSDAYIMPSLRPEGLPISVLEAQAAGLPVVVSDVGGAAASLIPDHTGYLFPRGDVDALVARLTILLADSTRRQAMGALGRRVAETRFSVDSMVRATENILLSTRPASAAPPQSVPWSPHASL